MEQKETYLSERQFISSKQKCNTEKKEYWEKLLGHDIFEILIHNYDKFNYYLKDNSFVSKMNDTPFVLEYILSWKEENTHYQKEKMNVVFPEFYKKAINYGSYLLKMELQNRYISEKIYIDFEEQLARILESISIRTLIAEMHIYNYREQLKGENSKEKYEYFCQKIITEKDFQQRIFEQYPILCRCTKEMVENMVDYYTDILEWFEKDKQAIQQMLCNGKDVYSIQRIKGGFSDVHKKGRYVVRVLMDNGIEILCKPRSMDSEKRYSELLQWLADETQISQYEYAILSYSDHSWCSIVEYESCNSQKELRSYYERLGVQLFLTYLLGTKDLHCENIIASGEYPVLIDLETLTNIRYNWERTTANDEICYQLSQSVLYTGMLPFYHWNQDGKGVNSSMISGTGGQRYPFKVPVIVHGGTSDMKIEYQQPESVRNQNLATIQGQFKEPLLYGEDLKRGFQTAYNVVMEKKEEFCALLRKLEKLKCRYLIADTQRYSMVLSSSYHPSLLRDGADREIFLYSMWKGRKPNEKKIVDSEVKTLLDGDIPYFQYCMDSKDLIDSQGKKINDYFANIPMELVYQKLEQLNKNDMEKQSEYIEMALRLMPERVGQHMNRVYRSKDVESLKNREGEKVLFLNKNIMRLTDRLLQNVIWNKYHNEVSWFTIQLSGGHKKNWNIRPMNMYLYDGLSGMLLLMYNLKRFDTRREFTEIYEILKREIFQYTDKGLKSLQNLQSRNTGAYEGESSIIYTYLLLYQEGKETIYLEYARKHARVVKQLIEEDTRCDLLNGNAGAAKVFLMLYEIFPDKEYIDVAENAVKVLEKTAEKMEQGIGWRTEKGIRPMAGAAHGNSGVLIPLIHLWTLTSKRKYEQLAEEVWMYEESLYDSELNNWVDVRSNQNKDDDIIGAMAWCHGAPGVLYSRMECCKYTEDLKWKRRFEKDIKRAYQKLKNYWKRDSWCLCHGICGNLWILEKAAEMLGEKEYNNYPLKEEVNLLPQEKVNPGLFNGYGGILLYLLEKYNE